jgi:hypothetical protein
MRFYGGLILRLRLALSNFKGEWYRPGSIEDEILQEDGYFLLQEDGFSTILLE